MGIYLITKKAQLLFALSFGRGSWVGFIIYQKNLCFMISLMPLALFRAGVVEKNLMPLALPRAGVGKKIPSA